MRRRRGRGQVDSEPPIERAAVVVDAARRKTRNVRSEEDGGYDEREQDGGDAEEDREEFEVLGLPPRRFAARSPDRRGDGLGGSDLGLPGCCGELGEPIVCSVGMLEFVIREEEALADHVVQRLFLGVERLEGGAAA
jgi:hypothetical protein